VVHIGIQTVGGFSVRTHRKKHAWQKYGNEYLRFVHFIAFPRHRTAVFTSHHATTDLAGTSDIEPVCDTPIRLAASSLARISAFAESETSP
jgi:hypothetical protein